jgi:hypothetical protein
MTPTAAPNVEQVVPFLWVRDIQASLRCYVSGLGFVKTKEWVDEGTLRWCWLELGSAAVMLQELSREDPRRNTPEGALGTGVALAFTCKDALALYREFRSRGIGAKRPFVGNAMWVTEVRDPDGYPLLFESPTDAAEETEYSE